MTRNLLFILGAVVFLAGCPDSSDDEPQDNSIQPTFNSVMMTNTTVAPVTTMHRPDTPDADWSFYREFEDLEEGNCYDIVVAPNAGQRFLAYTAEDEDGQWRLFVRASLGTEIWGSPENDSRSEPLSAPEFGCITPYINHLKEDLYGIAWVVDGTLSTAVFVPENPTGFELILGEEEDAFFAGVPIKDISLAYYNDSLRVIWMRPERDRIMQLRGQVSDSGMTLFDGATFTELDSTSHSDVIAREDGLYIAAADRSAAKLYHSAGAGTDWSEVASCDTPYDISHSLLYVDQAGSVRTLLTGASITNQRSLSFDDCSMDVLQVPIGNRGRITYSSGI